MTGGHPLARTRTSRIIKAQPEALYAAFTDPTCSSTGYRRET
jgi:hypothetical protein